MKTNSTLCLTNVLKVFVTGFILFMLASCASYDKVPYWQDVDRSKVTSETITNMDMITIQPQDQISISVTSTNQEAANVFSNSVQNSGTNASSPVYGYVVDQKGEVLLPLVGTVKVAGLTSNQLAVKLQQQLATYLNTPTVYVRIVNFKVAVMGDVMRPNVYTSNGERLTVTEALSLAGDMNITGKRQDVILVREIDGKRTYIPIDMTSKNLFQSPYFYLKPNDLIYVQPTKLKLENADTGYQKASLIISALSLVAIAISIFHR